MEEILHNLERIMEEVDKEIDEDENNDENEIGEKEAVEDVTRNNEHSGKLNEKMNSLNGDNSNNTVEGGSNICSNIDINSSIKEVNDEISDSAGIYSFEEPVALQFESPEDDSLGEGDYLNCTVLNKEKKLDQAGMDVCTKNSDINIKPLNNENEHDANKIEDPTDLREIESEVNNFVKDIVDKENTQNENPIQSNEIDDQPRNSNDEPVIPNKEEKDVSFSLKKDLIPSGFVDSESKMDTNAVPKNELDSISYTETSLGVEDEVLREIEIGKENKRLSLNVIGTNTEVSKEMAGINATDTTVTFNKVEDDMINQRLQNLPVVADKIQDQVIVNKEGDDDINRSGQITLCTQNKFTTEKHIRNKKEKEILAGVQNNSILDIVCDNKEKVEDEVIENLNIEHKVISNEKEKLSESSARPSEFSEKERNVHDDVDGNSHSNELVLKNESIKDNELVKCSENDPSLTSDDLSESKRSAARKKASAKRKANCPFLTTKRQKRSSAHAAILKYKAARVNPNSQVVCSDDVNLPEGWSRVVTQRRGRNCSGKLDVFYVSPMGKKLRSRNAMINHVVANNLDINLDLFDFIIKDEKQPPKTMDQVIPRKSENDHQTPIFKSLKENEESSAALGEDTHDDVSKNVIKESLKIKLRINGQNVFQVENSQDSLSNTDGIDGSSQDKTTQNSSNKPNKQKKALKKNMLKSQSVTTNKKVTKQIGRKIVSKVTKSNIMKMYKEGKGKCSICSDHYSLFGSYMKHIQDHYREGEDSSTTMQIKESKAEDGKQTLIENPELKEPQLEFVSLSDSTVKDKSLTGEPNANNDSLMDDIHTEDNSLLDNNEDPFGDVYNFNDSLKKEDETVKAIKPLRSMKAPVLMTHGKKRSSELKKYLYKIHGVATVKPEDDSSNVQFKCNYCGLVFKSHAEITVHMKIHPEEKPFGCPECPARFGHKRYVRRHMPSHTGEKPYKCSYCDKAFTAKGNLNKHLATHKRDNESNYSMEEDSMHSSIIGDNDYTSSPLVNATSSPALSSSLPVITSVTSVASMPSASRPFSKQVDVPESVDESLSSDSYKLHPRPPYTCGCLITLALKNSSSGNLHLQEIFDFLRQHFPYFRTTNVWKDSIRHMLSSSNHFKKSSVEGGRKRKFLWGINPESIEKLDEDLSTMKRKNVNAIKDSLQYPDLLLDLEKGEVCVDSRYENMQHLPRPEISPTTLITMALINSPDGYLHISEIYKFICEFFPYFRTAPMGWQDNFRWVLGANKYYEKTVISGGPSTKKIKYLWSIKPKRLQELGKEMRININPNIYSIKEAMQFPDKLQMFLEGKGNVKSAYKDEIIEILTGTQESCDIANSGGEDDIIINDHSQDTIIDDHSQDATINDNSQDTTINDSSQDITINDHSQDNWVFNEHEMPQISDTCSRIVSLINKELCEMDEDPLVENGGVETGVRKVFPKPIYNTNSLITLALKNSSNGCLYVNEVYSFIAQHFPYFQTAATGWTNAVCAGLSTKNNAYFLKINAPDIRKGKSLWKINPNLEHKLENDLLKYREKNLSGILQAMKYPELLPHLERGQIKFDSVYIKDKILAGKSSQEILEDDERFLKTEDIKNTEDLIPISSQSGDSKRHINDAAEGVETEKIWSKPSLPSNCLMSLAIKNSPTDSLHVIEIYSFICQHFPYYVTASTSWKDSICAALSTKSNDFFIRNLSEPGRSGKSLWMINPVHAETLHQEFEKFKEKELNNIKAAMRDPELLDSLEQGECKIDFNIHYGRGIPQTKKCSREKGSSPKKIKPNIVEEDDCASPLNSYNETEDKTSKQSSTDIEYTKPAYTINCLIGLALLNSSSNSLYVPEIYKFVCEHFPYFRTSSNAWKTTVCSTLSSSHKQHDFFHKCVVNSTKRGKYLWKLNLDNKLKLDKEVESCAKRFKDNITESLEKPEIYYAIQRGDMKFESQYTKDQKSVGVEMSEDEVSLMEETESEYHLMEDSSTDDVASIKTDTSRTATPIQKEIVNESNLTKNISPKGTPTKKKKTGVISGKKLEVNNSPLGTPTKNKLSDVISDEKEEESNWESDVPTTPSRIIILENETSPWPADREFPKPPYSHACLDVLALRNSRTGNCYVPEVYKFIEDHFPYYRDQADKKWRIGVCARLSSHEYFKKISVTGAKRGSYLWCLNKSMASKANKEIKACNKDLIRDSMMYPHLLEELQSGEVKFGKTEDEIKAENENTGDEGQSLVVKTLTPIKSTSKVEKEKVQKVEIAKEDVFNLPVQQSLTEENTEDIDEEETGDMQQWPETSDSYPKPRYSAACLVALAIKNSAKGYLHVSEIYGFMCEHFPYFRTAGKTWRIGVGARLSSHGYFKKCRCQGSKRGSFLWRLNRKMIPRINKEIMSYSKEDNMNAMQYPDLLHALENGEVKFESSWKKPDDMDSNDDDNDEVEGNDNDENMSNFESEIDDTNVADIDDITEDNFDDDVPLKEADNTLLEKTQDEVILPVNDFPKPIATLSCVIALALKNSPSGSLYAPGIYKFMCQHFPYYRNAGGNWKNAVCANLSSKHNDYFIRDCSNADDTKGKFLWQINPDKADKLDREVWNCVQRNRGGITRAMENPDDLDSLLGNIASLEPIQEPKPNNQESQSTEEKQDNLYPFGGHSIFSQENQEPEDSQDGSQTNKESKYPKPTYTMSCLITMALKNSLNGSMFVKDIYKFICNHFPYYRHCPKGWKIRVRQSLSGNRSKYFKKNNIAPEAQKGTRFLWKINSVKLHRLDRLISKYGSENPEAVKSSMQHPNLLEKLEKGEAKFDPNTYKMPEKHRKKPMPVPLSMLELTSNTQGGSIFNFKLDNRVLPSLFSRIPGHDVRAPKVPPLNPLNFAMPSGIHRDGNIGFDIPQNIFNFTKPPDMSFRNSNPPLWKEYNFGAYPGLQSKHLNENYVRKKPYKCPYCPKMCSSITNVISHMRVHTRKPLVCHFCQKHYSGSAALRRHMRIHTGLKPFKCVLCDYTCARRDHLTNHMTTHTNMKTFNCTQCPKKFRLKINLAQHMRKHLNPFNAHLLQESLDMQNSFEEGQNQSEGGSLLYGYQWNGQFGDNLQIQNIDSEGSEDSDDYEFDDEAEEDDVANDYPLIEDVKIEIEDEPLEGESESHENGREDYESDDTSLPNTPKIKGRLTEKLSDEDIIILDNHDSQDNVEKISSFENTHKLKPISQKLKPKSPSFMDILDELTDDVQVIPSLKNMPKPRKSSEKSSQEDLSDAGILSSSNGIDKGLACLYCDMEFGSPSEVLNHMRSHTSNKNEIICYKCDKRFSCKDDLEDHMTLHSGEDDDDDDDIRSIKSGKTRLEEELLIPSSNKEIKISSNISGRQELMSSTTLHLESKEALSCIKRLIFGSKEELSISAADQFNRKDDYIRQLPLQVETSDEPNLFRMIQLGSPEFSGHLPSQSSSNKRSEPDSPAGGPEGAKRLKSKLGCYKCHAWFTDADSLRNHIRSHNNSSSTSPGISQGISNTTNFPLPPLHNINGGGGDSLASSPGAQSFSGTGGMSIPPPPLLMMPPQMRMMTSPPSQRPLPMLYSTPLSYNMMQGGGGMLAGGPTTPGGLLPGVSSLGMPMMNPFMGGAAQRPPPPPYPGTVNPPIFSHSSSATAPLPPLLRHSTELSSITPQLLHQRNLIPKPSHANTKSAVAAAAALKQLTPADLNPVLSKLIQISKETQENLLKEHQNRKKDYPKPVYNTPCLVGLALKNSIKGLHVPEIYQFIAYHFPYYQTAPHGWKDAVRQNLCVSKFFKRTLVENSKRGKFRWYLNPNKIIKMDKDLKTFTEDEASKETLKLTMLYPELLEALERGEVKFDTSYRGKEIEDDDEQNKDDAQKKDDEHKKDDEIKKDDEPKNDEQKKDDDKKQGDETTELEESHDNNDETNAISNLLESFSQGQSDAPLCIGSEDPFELENNRAEEDLLEKIRRQWPTEKLYPKPPLTCSGLIALALKNSVSGSLPVTEIYRFLYEHFPWFRQAPKGWKNAIRMNLSNNRSNSWFEKIEVPIPVGSSRRRNMCWWELKPTKGRKLEEEFIRIKTTDIEGIQNSMQHPDLLDTIENGGLNLDPDKNAYMERSRYNPSPEKNIENLPQTSRSDSPPISLQKIFESQALRAILENLSKLSEEKKDTESEEGKENEKEKNINDDEKDNEAGKKIVEREEENDPKLESGKENSERKDKDPEESHNGENSHDGKDVQGVIKINENEGKNDGSLQGDGNPKNVENNSHSINIVRSNNDDKNGDINNEVSIQGEDQSGKNNNLQTPKMLKDNDEIKKKEENNTERDTSYIEKDLHNKTKQFSSNKSQSLTILKSQSSFNHSGDQNNENSQDNDLVESSIVLPVIRWKPYKEKNRRGMSEDRELETPVKRYSRIEPEWGTTDDIPPKPPYTCSCIIGLALKNSVKGKLPVYAIYRFLQEHFPYYRFAQTNWKILVRRQLSAYKWFIKFEENVHLGSSKRGITLWSLDPIKEQRMNKQLKIWLKKEREEIKKSMLHPDNLQALHRGEFKFDYDLAEEDIPEWAKRKEDVLPTNEIDNITENEEREEEMDDDYDDHFIELNNAEADIDDTDIEPIITADKSYLSQNMGQMENKKVNTEMIPTTDEYTLNSNGELGKKKNFKCDICMRMFSSSKYLEIHMRTHTGETPYSCDHCNRKFIRKSGMTRHVNICKQNSPDSVNESEVRTNEIGANEKLDTPMDIKDDVLILDKEKEKSDNPMITDLIWKSSTSHSFMEEHSEESKLYECQHCDRKFKKQQYLTAHMQVHQAGKPYECPHCPRKFSLNKHLTYHIKVHSLEEKYIKTYQSSPTNSETSQTSNRKKSLKEDDDEEGIKQRVAEILKAVVSTAVTGKDLSENEKTISEKDIEPAMTSYSNLKDDASKCKKNVYSVDDPDSFLKKNSAEDIKTILKVPEKLGLSTVQDKFDEDIIMEEVETNQTSVLKNNSKSIVLDTTKISLADVETETVFPSLRIESSYHNPNEVFQSDDEMETEEPTKSHNIVSLDSMEDKSIKTSKAENKNTFKNIKFKSSDISKVKTTAQKQSSLAGSSKVVSESSSSSSSTISEWTKWTPVDSLDTFDADMDNLEMDPFARTLDPINSPEACKPDVTKGLTAEKTTDNFSDITIEQNTDDFLGIQPDNLDNSLELVNFDDPLFSGVFDKNSDKVINKSNSKPFQCQYCNKHYSDSDALSKHLMLHSDDREFGCTECHLRFETKDGLTGHMRVHECEDQYKCSYCDYSSYRSHNTKKHMTTCKKKPDVQ